VNPLAPGHLGPYEDTSVPITASVGFRASVTSAERRARWRGDDVPEGFIRLSVGCEDTEDVIADIERALDASAVSVSSR